MLEPLTGAQLRQLCAALLSAFPNERELRQLTLFELRQNLFTIVQNSNLAAVVFDLIVWAEAHGELKRLIVGALNTNPDNPQLRDFVAQVVPDLLSTLAEPTAVGVAAGSDQTGTMSAPIFPKWRALLSDLASGQCTPILGPGLLEPLLGTPQDMARSWAANYHFPHALPASETLPQVAQFVATVENPNTLRLAYSNFLTKVLIDQYGDLYGRDKRQPSLDDLLHNAAKQRWMHDPGDPYRVLAALPCPVYITANHDNLLTEALLAAGRTPEIELCRWLDDDRFPASVFQRDRTYQPSVDRPLVYHLFGRLGLPYSLVLKEDDYFDFIAGVRRRQIPPSVKAALTDSALLFLGFRLDDWGFRVLFRSIIQQGASHRRDQYTSVAAQLDPQAENAPEPGQARRYLESYFGAADVMIYWGRSEPFLRDLKEQWTLYSAGKDAS